MQIKIIDKKFNQIKADWELIIIKDGNLKHGFVKDTKLLKELGFKGKSEEAIELNEKKKIYIGVKDFSNFELKLAGAALARMLKARQARSAKIALYFDNDFIAGTKGLVYGLLLGTYSFTRYKSKVDKKPGISLAISTENYNNHKVDLRELKAIIQETKVIVDAVNFTRNAVNLTPTDLNPLTFAKMAKELAKTNGLSATVYGKDYLKKNGMGAMLAVSQASQYPPQLIHLKYKGKDPKIKICLVGKGLTYDTGGLSLKPGEGMMTMKMDMGGAGAVIGAMKAVSELKLNIELEAILGAVENAIGKDAYKPDDVLTAKNKKTIEVKNTDAEGRLVLADCLCYAQEQNPDYIVDIATLTGACMVALGEYTSGLMGYNDELKHSLAKAAERGGELAGILPFNKYLEKHLKSEVADISNLSDSKYGGAITAALFLGAFIEDKYKERWAHIDIAGPAYKGKPWGENPFGASGAGVRILVEWIKELV